MAPSSSPAPLAGLKPFQPDGGGYGRAMAPIDARPEGVDLKVLRLQRRLSQRDIARQMGVARQRITAIEGDRRVSAEMAARYLAALARAARP